MASLQHSGRPVNELNMRRIGTSAIARALLRRYPSATIKGAVERAAVSLAKTGSLGLDDSVAVPVDLERVADGLGIRVQEAMESKAGPEGGP